MYRIAIVEDEDIFVEQLMGFVSRFEKESGEAFDVVRFSDGDEIAEYYVAEFDIIFMDIQMRFMDGMTAAKKIREMDSEVIIMFITNLTNYSILGYQVDALDYVLKPIEYFSFQKKIERAIKKMKTKKTPTVDIKIKSGLMRIRANEIYYIESDRHDLFYVTKHGRYKTRASMKEAQDMLSKHGFFRSNKSYLVNMQYVQGVSDGACIINGTSLLISGARKKDFMIAMTNYISNR